MKLRPLQDRILVQRVEEETTTKGGIIIPDTAKEKPAEGKVAAVSRVHPEPDYLRAEDNAFFLVSIPDKSQTSEINEYTLIAESEEYAAVPEFPVGTLVLLIATLSAYIGITRFSGRIITNLISATNLK